MRPAFAKLSPSALHSAILFYRKGQGRIACVAHYLLFLAAFPEISAVTHVIVLDI